MNQSFGSLVKLKLFNNNKNKENKKENINNDGDYRGKKSVIASSNTKTRASKFLHLGNSSQTLPHSHTSLKSATSTKNSSKVKTSSSSNIDSNDSNSLSSSSYDEDKIENNIPIPISDPEPSGQSHKSKMKRLKNKMHILDLNFNQEHTISHSKTTTDTYIKKDRSLHMDLEKSKRSISSPTSQLQSKPLDINKPRVISAPGIESLSVSPKRLSLEKFPTSSTTSKNTKNNSANHYISIPNNEPNKYSSTPMSRTLTDPTLNEMKSKKIITNFKKESMSSTSSLRFTSGTHITKEPIKKHEKFSSSRENLQKTQAINRKRSKTLDSSDLKKSNRILPSLPRFGTAKPPPVTGKTRQKSRNHSSSLTEKIHRVTSSTSTHSQGGSSSRSSSNKSSFSSPRVSSGSLPSNMTPIPPNLVQPATSTSSTYSISRRSSSIVNTLSSFVNLRSTSSSSNKNPQISSGLSRHYALKIEDLPKPPEPESDQEPFDRYLKRLAKYGKYIGITLSMNNDPYKLNCLRYFLLNYFDFVDDPLDISLRKLLIFIELPKEAQQIDRLLTEFGKAYFQQQREHDLEKCIWINEDQVYFAIFSMLMLHTDYFNANNKVKMTRSEFIDLVHNDTYSYGNEIPVEILGYYYENIVSKESPKFPFLQNIDNSIITFDYLEDIDVYSPKYIIMNKLLGQGSLYDTNVNNNAGNSSTTTGPPTSVTLPPPSICNNTGVNTPSFFNNRTASNSISSYFSHHHHNNSHSNSNAMLPFDDINIYYHIFNNELRKISLCSKVVKYLNDPILEFESTPLNSMDTKYEKYFNILRDLKGGYIKIISSHIPKIRLPPYEIVRENKTDPYSYFKIIQMGEIQEFNDEYNSNGGSNSTGGNERIFSIGKEEKWKKKMAVLTTCGIFVYDKKKSLEFTKPEIVRDEISGETNYIVEFKNNCDILNCYNLFAEKIEKGRIDGDDYNNDDDDVYNNAYESGYGYGSDTSGGNEYDRIVDDKSFILWGQYGKFIWKTGNKYERDNWINSVNIMSALDGCINPENISTICNTIMSIYRETAQSKYDESQEDKLGVARRIRKEIQLMNLYKQCIPISIKTRAEMIELINQQLVKMDWFHYEMKRDCSHMRILKEYSAKIGDRGVSRDRAYEKESSSLEGNDGGDGKEEEKCIKYRDNDSNNFQADVETSLSFITFT